MLVSFLKKFFEGKTFVIKSYGYTFIKVTNYEGDEDTPDILVNVTTKNPFQSYCQEKMRDDVKKIMYEKLRLIGVDKGGFFLNLKFNGRTPKEIFISLEDREKIFFLINKKQKFFKYINAKGETISYEAQFYPKQQWYFKDTDDEIDINVSVNFRTFEKNGEKLVIDETKYPALLIKLQNDLNQSSDDFRIEVENIVYDVLEPNLQLEDLEIFFNVYFIGSKINDTIVSVHNTENDVEILGDLI